MFFLQLKNCIEGRRRRKSLEKICHVSVEWFALSPSEDKSLCIKSESKNVFLPLLLLADFSPRSGKNCLMARKNKTKESGWRKKFFWIIFLCHSWGHRTQRAVLLFFMETPFNKRLIDWSCKCVLKGERWKSIEMFVSAKLSFTPLGRDKLHGILFANLDEWSSRKKLSSFEFPTLVGKKTFRRLENSLSTPAENNFA